MPRKHLMDTSAPFNGLGWKRTTLQNIRCGTCIKSQPFCASHFTFNAKL